jgi:deoxyribonuclease V
MDFPELHSWDLDFAQARALQAELAGELDTRSKLGSWATVAAADISYNKHDPRLFAAVVVTDARTFEVIERAEVVAEARFPYVPGFLSFREAPAVLEAFRRLKTRPDVVICDGQGTAHPRRLGLACHIGLWIGLPTIGCAKSRLVGDYDEPGPDRGARSPLLDRGETIGAVVRTRARVKPVFVSPGHKCDLDSAVAVVLASTTRYRMPDPSRLAHERVNELRRAAGSVEKTE